METVKIAVKIVPERPFEEAVEKGKALGATKLREEIATLRKDPLVEPVYGQTSDAALCMRTQEFSSLTCLIISGIAGLPDSPM